MSLCRLFEMLLTEPVKTNPGDKNIRTWIMVNRLSQFNILMDIITLLIQTLALYLRKHLHLLAPFRFIFLYITSLPPPL